MNKIRTTIGAVALVVTMSACTPGQTQYWVERILGAEATADPADDAAVEADLAQIPAEPDTACREWFWYAMEAGFTYSQWMEPLSRIMYRESHCDPGAHNPSGASGLTQVMPMWADDCGGVPADLFDPAFNLRCAKHVLDVSGWGAWSTL